MIQIQIILAFAILQLAYNLLFKPKNNQLACGLFGAAADDVSKININKIKILGIFNDARGGHSCGLAIDGDTIKGTYKNKLFKDFISSHFIDAPLEFPVVLGHTRMATGGTHSEENAHPFSFGVHNGYDSFQGTHNGTLYNHLDLAKNYDIKTSAEYVSTYNTRITRQKIDSEVLLEIIYNNGFKVLEEYEGAAALAMYNTKKPKTIYMYHGASKKFKVDTELSEERPLFYYQEAPGVFYYSSIRESLEAINDTARDIEEFEFNIVYEIKNGNVASAKKHKIDRSNAFQTRQFEVAKHVPIDYSKKEWDQVSRSWVDKKPKSTPPLITTTSANDNNLFIAHKNTFENTHEGFIMNNIYFENLRFFKNKSLINGIYAVDKQCNLSFVSMYPALVDDIIKTNINSGILDDDPKRLYFVNGVAFNTLVDYNAIRDRFHAFTPRQLSEASVYPVKGYAYDDVAFFRGQTADLTFTSLFGKSVIEIKEGKCTSIKEKSDAKLDEYIKYLLPEDKGILEASIAKEIKKVEEVSDEETMIELYQDNLIATVEYCSEDTESSFDDVKTQSLIKSKLEEIKQFVIKTLKK
jgi:predicted glutamine amidotransferase